jgi:hypothetical protein
MHVRVCETVQRHARMRERGSEVERERDLIDVTSMLGRKQLEALAMRVAGLAVRIVSSAIAHVCRRGAAS